jgi:hypothetical protein
MLFRGAALYGWAIGASQRIHTKSVHRVLYAPLGFFFSVRPSRACGHRGPPQKGYAPAGAPVRRVAGGGAP